MNMIITIQKRRKDFCKRKFFYEYESFEIESFRWEKRHVFSYVKKGSSIWRYLEKDEELVGMKL